MLLWSLKELCVPALLRSCACLICAALRAALLPHCRPEWSSWSSV
ncbi:secreted protein [gut metagenome]|uniref:Secreted protein n=1 Tax=gut metagenome TaxID=749906 RepID=J9FK91_9ZZZZ